MTAAVPERLARMASFVPRPRLAGLMAAASLLLLLAAFVPPLVGPALVLAVLPLLMAAVDLARTETLNDIDIRRHHPAVLSHGEKHDIVVTARHHRGLPVQLEIEEVWPESVSPRRVRLHLRVPGDDGARQTYQVIPHRRGALTVSPMAVRSVGPWGLVARQSRCAAPASSARVYPNLRGIARYELAARRQLTAQVGVRSGRRRGAGTDIEGLREYVPDDEFRRIDWKATARRGAPVTRLLREDQSQSIHLMIDGGRLGAVEMAGAARLDFAINAALVLAHVAAMHGDRVGVMVFDREIRRHMPPGRASRAIVTQMARLLYDVAPVRVESDYARAFDMLATRERRRGLVILFSDILSSAASEIIIDRLGKRWGNTAHHHLPLCVAIADPALAQASDRIVTSAADVYHVAAALELRQERAVALQSMRSRGILTVDVLPTAITPAVIGRYLDLKKSGKL